MVAVETTGAAETPGLVLYYKGTCPYCRRVLRRAEELGVFMELRSTWEREHRERLVEIGGKRQVPCLLVNGAPMYESAEIIDFLERQARKD